MSALHFWFRSGNYSLLGQFHPALGKPGRVGVVIVPPFGWENVCCYRPLKFMANAFAQAGIPTLRYDLPGTGDSSGGANDPGLFASWIQSVGDAAEELRRLGEVEEVATVGIHFGATLALAASSRGVSLRHLVLWGTAAKGRTIIRELRAAANLERHEYLAEVEAPPQPVPGFESGGFLIAPETLRALEDLEITALPRPDSERILLLSRDDLPHDATLVAALKDSACNFDLATGRGYSAMTATPQEALFPEETSQLIVKLLTAGIDEVYSAPRSTAVNGRVPNETSAAGCLESIYRFHRFDTSVSGMFGILAQPEPPVRQSDYCLLYLNAGPVRHTGPNRMWVESARRWAAQGVASLRFDLTGIGESEGEQYLDVPSLYQDRLMDQIKAAIDSLRGLGLRRFVAIGLCSGACWALHSAIRYADVRAAIVLNPSLLSWDAGADRRRMLRDAANGFSHWTDLGRKIRGGMQKGEIRRAAHRVAERLGRRQTSKIRYLELGFETPSMAWSGLERDQKRVTLVFREGEPLLAELEAAGQLPLDSNSLVRCVRVPNGGHTFRPLWAQKLVHEIIDAEIAEILRQEGQTDHRGRSPQAVHV